MTKIAIEIRATEPEDYEALQNLYARPKVIRGTLQMPYPSKELWRGRLNETNQGRTSLVAEVNDRVVGNIGLTLQEPLRRRHVGTIGMGVHDEFQGRGIGNALLRAALDLADNWLNLARIELNVYINNEPAIALYRRHGFEVEGTFKDYSYRNGAYEDVHAMARLREA